MADFGETEPVTDPAPEPEATPAPDPAAPEATPAPAEIDYSTFGDGVDQAYLQQAVATQRALATEEGVTDYFVQAGLALGLTPDQMTALFDTPSPNAPADPATPAEPDTPPTREEIMQMIRELAVEPVQQQQQQQQVAAVRSVIGEELGRLEVPEAERDFVLKAADSHLSNGEEYDPAKVREAIAKGYEDYTKTVEAAAERIFARRAAEGETLPRPLSGGSSPGGEETAEPTTVEEAKARVRENLKARGLL